MINLPDQPAWTKKHPCGNCDTGYGTCAQGLKLSLKCCNQCEHPTRWASDPWTATDLIEMWDGQEMPDIVKDGLQRLTTQRQHT